MPETLPYPEFELDVVASIGDAALVALRSDAELLAFFATGGGIVEIESERISIDVSSVKAPLLGVSLGPVRERRIGNDDYTELAVALDLLLLTPYENARGTQRWLRPRLVNRIKARLAANHGQLEDAEGNLLTEALIEFERLDFTGALKGRNVIATLLRAVFRADIDQIDRGVIP